MSEVNDIAYLVDVNASQPVVLTEAEVRGSQALRDSVIQRQLQPLYDAATLGDLVSELENTASRLRAFQVHRSVAYLLDLDPTKPKRVTPSGEALNLRAVLSLDEEATRSFTASTLTRDDEAGINVSAGLRNVFGGAESLTLDASFASRPRDRSSYCVSFESPLLGFPYARAVLSRYVVSQAAPWASHSQLLRGISAKLNSVSSTTGILTEFGFDMVNRSLVGIAAGASDAVRAAAGDNFKASLTARLLLDKRDDALYPTQGYLLDVNGELAGANAGLLGDVSFAKGSVEASGAVSLDPKDDRLVLTATGGLGLLHGDNSTILDRFFIGGAKDIYGFQYNGLGPKDDGDAIGGHGYALGNVSLYAKLPRLTDSPLRAVFLFNGATLASPTVSESTPQQSFNSLLTNVFARPSTAAGFGLSYRTPSAQLELIYSVPLSTHDTDAVRKGLQFGVGLSV